MPEPIDWVSTNVGFIANEVYDTGRKVRRPNAQIVALTVLWNIFHEEDQLTYRDMYTRLIHDFKAWVVKPGRMTKHQRFFRERLKDGHSVSLNAYRMPSTFYKDWIAAHFPQMEWVATTFIGAKAKLHLDEDAFDKEQIILARCSGDELVPIIKGVAHYPWDPNHQLEPHVSRMVYGFWTTT